LGTNSAKRAGTDVVFMRIIFDSFYLVVFCLVLMSDERFDNFPVENRGRSRRKRVLEKRPEGMRLVLNAHENENNS
jgi:hypothetical protein